MNTSTNVRGRQQNNYLQDGRPTQGSPKIISKNPDKLSAFVNNALALKQKAHPSGEKRRRGSPKAGNRKQKEKNRPRSPGRRSPTASKPELKPYKLDLTEHENLIAAMIEPKLAVIPDFVQPPAPYETEQEDQGNATESEGDDFSELEREQKQGALLQRQIQEQIESLKQMDY